MNRRDGILSQEELLARAAELAVVPAADVTPGAGTGLLIVTVDGTRLGLELTMVREVIAQPAVTPLPLTPPCVAGVVNLRYQVLAALDLAALRGSAAVPRRPFGVVVEHGDLAAALLVDTIDEVVFDADRRALEVLSAQDLLHHPDLLPLSGEVIE